jgi:hypothetical protein
MTVHELVLELALYAARNPDAQAVTDDNLALSWATRYPEITTVERLPDGRIVIR